MKTRFREAFIRRFQADGTKVVEIVKKTGVSRSKINKLLDRQNDKVEVTDAIAIAGYYGMTVEEFMFGGQDSPKAALIALSTLLSDDEARLLAHQIEGLVAARDQVQTPPAKQRDE